MGRMHAPGKGISQSALPYRRSVPQWLKLTSDEVKDQIYKLAKKGLTPSQIGVILRDSHGVAQVSQVFIFKTKLIFNTCTAVDHVCVFQSPNVGDNSVQN